MYLFEYPQIWELHDYVQQLPQMKKKTASIFNVGISSILIIFILLSLVSFATLALITARSDYMLSRKYADRVESYYAAENQAIQKWNALNEQPEGAEVSYQIPINDSQQLAVTLTFSEKDQRYDVKEGKTENVGNWEADETLHLYTGD